MSAQPALRSANFLPNPPATLRGMGRIAVLILEMAGRSYKLRFAGSYMGLLWSVLGPLCSALVTATIFSFLMRGRMGASYAAIPYGVFYFVGFSIWGMISEVISRSTTTVVENATLITKISFPSAILPAVVVVTCLINYAVYLAIAVVLVLVHGVHFGSHMYLLPIYFLLGALLSAGIGYAAAAIGVFVRDLTHAIPIVLNILFFLSPISYSPDVLRQNAPGWVQALLLKWNPISQLIEGYRTSFIEVGAQVDVGGLLYLSVMSLAIFVLGFISFHALKPLFADVL